MHHQAVKKKKNGYLSGIFSQIFICSSQELAPFGTVFVFSPENYDEQPLGTLFGVIKVDDLSDDSSYVVNLLTSVIKKEYFSKPERGAEESFEVSLRKANLALAELARHGSLGWSGKINFAAGALSKNFVHFSSLGSTHAFLIRSGQIAEISQELEEEKDSEPHPLKTFSNISSGKLEKEDKLIFATGDLTDIFSKEELRQNANHFSREEFPGFLEMSLGANAKLAGAIVIDLAKEPAIAHTHVSFSGSAEKETVPRFEPVPAAPHGPRKIDSFVAPPEKDLGARSGASDMSPYAGLSFWKKTQLFFKNAVGKTIDAAKGLVLRIILYFRQPDRREKLRKFVPQRPISAALNLGKKSWQRTQGLRDRLGILDARKKKVYWGIFGAVVLIAIVFLNVLYAQNKKAAAPAPPPENAPTESQVALVLDDKEARKIENVEEFAALSQKGSRAALLGNSLFTISGSDKKISALNLETKAEESAESDLPGGNFEMLAAMPHLNTIFLLTGDRKVISFTPVNKKFQENNISLPGNLKSQEIRSYLTYLYVLDTANGQIYRYPRAEGGFGEVQNWLRSATDLKNTRGIAINDDLYIAESGGITAYLQGKKDENVDFEAPGANLSIDRIYSEPGMEFVWVLDNKNHRVLRYAKDGKISAQFLNESISEVKDFAVDEKNKAVYLLKNNQVLKFSTD
jgi:hypothetical protein